MAVWPMQLDYSDIQSVLVDVRPLKFIVGILYKNRASILKETQGIG